jgi:hypothetical protein
MHTFTCLNCSNESHVRPVTRASGQYLVCEWCSAEHGFRLTPPRTAGAPPRIAIVGLRSTYREQTTGQERLSC